MLVVSVRLRGVGSSAGGFSRALVVVVGEVCISGEGFDLDFLGFLGFLGGGMRSVFVSEMVWIEYQGGCLPGPVW